METFATTLPDYTQLPEYLHKKIPSSMKTPTFCVEIKPKQGFVSPEISKIRGKCDYCSKQLSKIAEGKISKPSEYCPCDLFSGKKVRMRRALSGLVRSTQNNFRIFRNGELVYGEGFDPDELEVVLAEWLCDEKPFDKEKALDRMFEIVIEALLRPFPQNKSCWGTSNHSPAETLPRDSVLEKILRVQRLDNHGIDFVHSVYSEYSRVLDDEVIYAKKRIEREADQETSNSLPSEAELLALRNYLLFRIARDCSIMTAYRAIDLSAISSLPAENVIKTSNSRCFVFNNAVTDLDPKSVHRIEKYHRQKRAKDFRAVS